MTAQEGRSDLGLEAEVREHAPGFRFTVNMVYVPYEVSAHAAVEVFMAARPGGATGMVMACTPMTPSA